MMHAPGSAAYHLPGAPDAAYAPNWAVTDWYLDGTVGLDTNDGITAGTPLRTGAELARRLGPYALWSQSVTIHVLASGMTDGLVLRGAMLVAGNGVRVMGTPTQLADAGTVTVYTALDHATTRAPQIQSSLIADWTPYQWRRLRISSGANSGACTFVATYNPLDMAGVPQGVQIARTARWGRVSTSSTSLLKNSITPAVGDPVVIESLARVPAISIVVDGPCDLTPGIQSTKLQWLVDGIDCPSIRVDASTIAHIHRGIFFGCRLNDSNTVTSSSLTQDIADRLCCLIGRDDAHSPVVTPSGNYQYCVFGDGLSLVGVAPTNPAAFQIDNVFQGAKVSSIRPTFLLAQGMQIFDVVGSAALLLSNGVVNGLSGCGNTGVGLAISNSSTVALSGVQNLLGTVANFQLTSAPAVNLTIAQGIQPSDYAQKGITAAMVAGAVTVTVPWYDNATQQVTVSHAAFAGTPGILSVQQISTTQFTITSSSVLDTSTVRWQISPLGRNIFISTT